MPGVEPDVADLEDRASTGSPHASQRIGTRSIHGRRSSSSCSKPSTARSRSSAFDADHVQVAARARVERQRQAVVAAARDVPVAHVAQPVVHALAHVLGHPLDRRVRLEQPLADSVDGDEPVVGDPEDQRRVAAPAVRVARASYEPGLDEEAGLAEAADDLVGGLGRREAVQPAVVVVEAARPRRPASAPRRPCDLARARSPRRRSRARCGRCRCPGPSIDLVPRDDAVLDRRARRRGRRTGRGSASPTSSEPRSRSHERVVGEARDRDPLAVLAPAVLARRGGRRRRRSPAASTASSSRRRPTRPSRSSSGKRT